MIKKIRDVYGETLASALLGLGLAKSVMGPRDICGTLSPKRSITLLAPGSSVLRLSDNDFKLIGEGDSIGLNYFCVHDFVPSLYMMEPHDTNQHYFELLKCLNRSIPTLFKGYLYPKSFVKTIRNLISAKQRGLEVVLMRESRSQSLGLDLTLSSNFFYLAGNSLSTLIVFALLLGYENINLVGFDNDGDYFYDVSNSPAKYQAIARKFGCAGRSHLAALDPAIMVRSERFLQEVLEHLSDVNPYKRVRLVNCNESYLHRYFTAVTRL